MSKQFKNTSYYDWTENISTYYIDGFSIATLDHSSDDFESIVYMSEKDKDYYYAEMQKKREEYLNQ